MTDIYFCPPDISTSVHQKQVTYQVCNIYWNLTCKVPRCLYAAYLRPDDMMTYGCCIYLANYILKINLTVILYNAPFILKTNREQPELTCLVESMFNK